MSHTCDMHMCAFSGIVAKLNLFKFSRVQICLRIFLETNGEKFCNKKILEDYERGCVVWENHKEYPFNRNCYKKNKILKFQIILFKV